MKYLAIWRWGCLFGNKQLLWSGRMVLSGDALRPAGDSTGMWPLFGLFVCSWFKHRFQKKLLVEKIWVVEK